MPAFDITTTTSEIPLTEGQGRVDFTVTNRTGRSISARADLQPIGNTDPAWLKFEGDREREFAVNEAEKFTVAVTVPSATPAGAYSFRIRMVATSESASEFNQSSEPVGFSAPGPADVPEPVEIEPPPERRSIWMLVSFGLAIVAAVLLMLIIFFLLRDGGDEPPPSPPPRPSPSPTATPSPTLPNLDLTNWRAVTVAGAAPVPGSEPILSFNGPVIEGTDGCNLYTATAMVADGRLVITSGVSQTRRACFGELDQVARAFMEVIRTGGDLSVDVNGQLHLIAPAGEVAFGRIVRVREGIPVPSIEPPRPLP